MKKILCLLLLISSISFSQTYVDLSDMTEDVILGQNCSQSQTPQEFVTGNVKLNGYTIRLRNSNLKIEGFILETGLGGEIDTCGQSTFCPQYSMNNNFDFNLEDMDCTNGQTTDDCPIAFTEPGQLYFSSSTPLILSENEIEIGSSEYEFAGSYIQTQGGVPVSWTYYFEIEEGTDWNLTDTFSYDFLNVTGICTYGNPETLSTPHIEKEELTKYSINNNILTIDRATTIQLFDMNGRLVKSSKTEYIDISYLTKGMYIALASNERMTSSIKLIL